MKVKDFRRELSKRFSECDGIDIFLILSDVLKIEKTAVLLGMHEVSFDEEREIIEKVSRLAEGEPVSYILGEREFMSLPFYVKKGVLIPRQDTEVLVETLISKLDRERALNVIDMCTGSGCIGISLAYYMDNINLSMCDISDVALEVSEKNAKRHIRNRDYKVFKIDLLKDFPEDRYDCIVSNPPYIKTDVIEGLEKKVKDFEPSIALDGGDDGLIFYRRIAKEAKLNDGGILAFEIGFDQGKEVSDILVNLGYKDVSVIKDIENRDRVVLGFKGCFEE